MDDNINLEIKFDNICRTCLNESDDLRSIFRPGKVLEEVTTLSDMLLECTALECREDDELPDRVCMKCVIQISKSYVFRKTCIKSDACLREKLQSKFNEDDTVGPIYFYDDSLDQQNIEEIEDTEEMDQYNEEIQIEIKPDDNTQQDVSTEVISEYENEVTEEVTEIKLQGISIAKSEDLEMNNSTTEEKYDTDFSENPPNIIFRKRRQRTKKLPGPPFKCEVCGKVLSNHSSYKYHMQLHSDNTPFLCSECGEGFKTRNAYDGHMTTHNKNNPHTCKLCGKIYRQASSLRCHMLSHTGEKPFLCGICGKGMTQKSGFKKHMLTHTGEKPHTCDICFRKFRYSSNLITHKRSHVGEKPYACTVVQNLNDTQ